jgi:predicted nucleic acid-binding protein
MELVVDANVLFAALLGRDKTMDLFFEDKLRLVSPSYLLDEFEKNRQWLVKECGITAEEFDELLGTLLSRIEFFPLIAAVEHLSKAEQLAPHKKDVPYFALALYLNCAIWSREKAFKKQSVVLIYSTPEIVEMFL